MAGERILIADDDAAIRRTVAAMLSSADYECVEAASLQEAQEALENDRLDLVVCDPRMAGDSGLTLVRQIEAAPDQIAVLLVIAIDGTDVAHAAAILGADGCLVKPFSLNQLLINVDCALREGQRRKRATEAEREQERGRVREVRDATSRLEREACAADGQAAELLQRLSEAIGRRDLQTGAHIRRIGEFSALLAEASGMSRNEVEAIGLAAPMSDVGKVAIPDSVLLKPGGLDPDERELVERHPEIGHHILSASSSPLLKLAAEIALTHQEKVNGSGYPQGIEGDAIPVAGRIVAVTDVYDALTSDRPYRAAPLPVDEAVLVMVAGRGIHFDPQLLDHFLARLDAVQAIAREFADPETE